MSSSVMTSLIRLYLRDCKATFDQRLQTRVGPKYTDFLLGLIHSFGLLRLQSLKVKEILFAARVPNRRGLWPPGVPMTAGALVLCTTCTTDSYATDPFPEICAYYTKI